jgi:hypothetical protein
MLSYLENFIYILILSATILWFIYGDKKDSNVMIAAIVVTCIATLAAAWNIYSLYTNDGFNIMNNLLNHIIWIFIMTSCALWYSFYMTKDTTIACNLKTSAVGFTVASILFIYIQFKILAKTSDDE